MDRLDKSPEQVSMFPGARSLLWIFAGMSFFGWLVFLLIFGHAGFMWFVLGFAVVLFVLGLLMRG